MQSERWRKIEEVFQAALGLRLEDRDTFLRTACDGDTELLDEVQSLLNAHGSGDVPASAGLRELATLLHPGATAFWPGDKFGRYEIVRELGAGGMGAVYLTLDTYLGRPVALKLLRTQALSASERVRRFQIEARAASALNHPRIITIYDAGEIEGQAYIAAEYVDGESLRAWLRRGRASTDDVLAIGIQVADAISAAHRAGIVHRDLKPENILVRADGSVKVLDFGLAKSVGLVAGTAESAHTQEGAALGTLPYMSPEQIEGGDTDLRSDVWSFGVVLYELAAGRHPFTAPTAAETAATISRGAFPPLPKDVPRGLRRLIEQALSVAVQSRPRDATEVAAELDVIGRRWKARGRWVRLAAPITVAAVLTAAALIYLLITRSKPSTNLAISPLTSTGNVIEAAISPDGKYVAFATGDAERQSLLLRQVATGADLPLVTAAPVSFQGISFSSNGDYIFYSIHGGHDAFGSLWRIAAVGSMPPQKILDDIDSAPALSPDGKYVAFIREGSRPVTHSDLIIAEVDGAHAQRVCAQRTGSDGFARALSWSPDAQRLAVAVFTGKRTRTGIEGFQVRDGTWFRFTSRQWRMVNRIAWTAEGLVLVATEDEASGAQIFRLEAADSVTRLTKGLATYGGLSVASSGAMVAISHLRTSSVWVGPASTPEQSQKISPGTGRYFGASWLSNDELVTRGEPAGAQQLWSLRLDQSQPHRLVEDRVEPRNVRACGDGRHFVFSSNRSGEWRIWAGDGEGQPLRQLSQGPGSDQSPTCSQDGRVIFSSDRTMKSTLWTVPVLGGKEQEITNEVSYYPEISPDGTRVACTFQDRVGSMIRLVVAVLKTTDGAVLDRVENAPSSVPLRWVPGGTALAFKRIFGGVENIWTVPIHGGSARQMTHFQAGQIFAFEWSRDGMHLATVQGTETHDVVLFKTERAQM